MVNSEQNVRKIKVKVLTYRLQVNGNIVSFYIAEQHLPVIRDHFWNKRRQMYIRTINHPALTNTCVFLRGESKQRDHETSHIRLQDEATALSYARRVRHALNGIQLAYSNV